MSECARPKPFKKLPLSPPPRKYMSPRCSKATFGVVSWRPKSSTTSERPFHSTLSKKPSKWSATLTLLLMRSSSRTPSTTVSVSNRSNRMLEPNANPHTNAISPANANPCVDSNLKILRSQHPPFPPEYDSSCRCHRAIGRGLEGYQRKGPY